MNLYVWWKWQNTRMTKKIASEKGATSFCSTWSTFSNASKFIFLITGKEQARKWPSHEWFGPSLEPIRTIPGLTGSFQDWLDYSRTDFVHSRTDFKHLRTDLDHPTTDLDHLRTDLDHPENDLDNPMTEWTITGLSGPFQDWFWSFQNWFEPLYTKTRFFSANEMNCKNRSEWRCYVHWTCR